ncbi:MAG TPA: carboxylating nicotinate-nucleotide diphosphorylase [Bdellovibrionota bacterium]|nr:carboxylating nicotinate-nucleotide diphosphorylase [Bdellovibrionota bacterium]
MFTDDIIRRALEEDIGSGDVTTDSVVSAELRGHGRIMAKETLVVAGLGVAGGVFLTADPHSRFKQTVSDGDLVQSGTVILEVDGTYRSLLKAERVALNFLQRLCGIATLTRTYVESTKGTKTKILDTRKTVPLLRHLDKYAVRMGGGVNHRLGLYDAILVKDNHIAACKGSVAEATAKAKTRFPGKPVTVEIAKSDDVEPAIEAGATRLLLDNMSDADVDKCVKMIRGRTEIEVSGGVTLERVAKLSKLGVDYISVGALTHSPRAVDISFEIEPA